MISITSKRPVIQDYTTHLHCFTDQQKKFYIPTITSSQRPPNPLGN